MFFEDHFSIRILLKQEKNLAKKIEKKWHAPKKIDMGSCFFDPSMGACDIGGSKFKVQKARKNIL